MMPGDGRMRLGDEGLHGQSGKAVPPRRARLLHVTTIPMSLTFLRGQVGYMKARGFDVHVVSSPGDDLTAFGRDEEVPVSAVPMTRRISPGADLRALLGLVAVVRSVRPTIVHAHTPKAGLLGMIAGTLSRTPVRVYHMRGLPLLASTGLRRRVLRFTERTACRLAHRVLCVSGSVRAEALREGVCPPGKISVLARGSGNGVDSWNRFHPERVGGEARDAVRRRLGIPPSATVVGFVGRVVRDKGIVELAEAWQRLREAHPDAHLLVVGPWETEDPVPPSTEAALLEDPRVHRTGMDWNTPPLYAAMDVVALPTYREGFPNVPLEAGAMGLPVVATRVPGCVDAVVDGVTGLLVPPADAGSLARALGRYLRDPVLRGTHGARGQDRVRREFRQDTIWESLHHEYLALLRREGCSVPAAPEGLRDAVA